MFDMRQIMQAVQNGTNPNQIAQRLIQQNPAVRQAAQMMNGKTPAQIREMAYGMARQNGIDLNNMARQLGVKLPE